jgi:hypothetical protein
MLIMALIVINLRSWYSYKRIYHAKVNSLELVALTSRKDCNWLKIGPKNIALLMKFLTMPYQNRMILETSMALTLLIH